MLSETKTYKIYVLCLYLYLPVVLFQSVRYVIYCEDLIER
jgi:hypothetical protein